METTSGAKKYARKTLIVDAYEVTEESFEDVVRWCTGEVHNIDETAVDKSAPLEPTKQYIRVRVHNPKSARQTKAYIGDWILWTERGYKVYTPKAFEMNFEPAENQMVGAQSDTPELEVTE